MQRNKNRKNAWKAALAVAILGTTLFPGISQAVTPRRTGHTDNWYMHNYEEAYDWTNDANFNTEISANKDNSDDTDKLTLWIQDEFYFYNGYSGKKKITTFTNCVSPITFTNSSFGGASWKGVNGETEFNDVTDSATLVRSDMKDEVKQNHVNLYNEQTHKVDIDVSKNWWSWPYSIYTVNVYYTVEEFKNSYLNFDDTGITWTPNGTLLTLNHKFDFGTEGLVIDASNLKLNVSSGIPTWESMILLDDGGYYANDMDTFYRKTQSAISATSKTMSYDLPQASLTWDGSVTLGLLWDKTDDNHNQIKLVASDSKFSSLGVNINKIGKGKTDASGKATSDQYTSGGTLFSFTSGRNYAKNPLTISFSGTGIYNGATDTEVAPNTAMTLINIKGTNTDSITTKYNGKTIKKYGYIDLGRVNYTETTSGGISVNGAVNHRIAIDQDTDFYMATYYTDDKDYISSFTSTGDGIDLSNASGGFSATSSATGMSYDIGDNLVFDISKVKFTNTNNAKNFTLIDVTDANYEGKLWLKSDEYTDPTTAVTLAGEWRYAHWWVGRGVTALGTQNDIQFSTDETQKKINVSVTPGWTIRQLNLQEMDLTYDTAISNLAKTGEIKAWYINFNNLDLQTAASKNAFALVRATGTHNFKTGWTGLPTDTKTITVSHANGITGTVYGTMNTDDGNINLATGGLDTLTFGENIAWDTSKTAVTLTGGTLGTIDFSKISFTGRDDTASETMHLLDAQNMSGDMALTVPTDWTEETSLDSTANITTYTGNVREEKVTQENGIEGGIALNLDRVDEIVATRTQNEDSTQNLTLDYLTNKAFAKTFSIGKGIKWVKDGTAIKLSEQYDYSQMANQAISFDASNPYALIANPDEVGIGESMTFFDAAGYMTDDEWKDKVYISNASGSSEPTYSETARGITIEGKVNLELTKDDTHKKVIGTVSDEYLSKVGIDLSYIGDSKKDGWHAWNAGGTIYDNTTNTQDYGDTTKKVEISLSNKGNMFGGTTDEKVETGTSMKLIHIQGKNAGAEGSFDKFDDTNVVNFSDTTENGIVAAGSHIDTIKSETDATNHTYDVVYTIGQKVVTGISSKSVDLTKSPFTSGTQYTLGTANVTIDASQIGIANPGDGTRTKIIDFSSDSGSGKFVLSNTEAKALYNETDAEAVNGVRAEGYEKNTFSLSEDAKTVYWDFSERDTQLIDIGTVDFSKAVREFTNLAKDGYIVNWLTKYIYSKNTAISEVTGKKLAIATSTGENNFSGWIKFGGSTLPTNTEEISVTQETGISAVVKGTYDAGDNNLNLKTNGLKSLTFGENVVWNANDTAAVAIFDQDIDTLDVTNLSFAGADDKKNETMHLVSAQNMTNFTYDTTKWTERAGETGKTLYDKDNRTHDDNDNLSGYGITLAVDRGDQMVKTVASESGKTGTTLDYIRGKGYIKGMSIDVSGIRWENGKTAITLDEDYDFSAINPSALLTFDASKLQVSNVSELSSGDTMTLLDAAGHMSDADWKNTVSVSSPTSKAYDSYTNNPSNAVEISGKVDIELTNDDKNKKVIGTVSEQYMSAITIDLSKIGEEADGIDAWSTEKTLYDNTTSKQDYAKKNISVSIDSTKQIYGGMTDETIQTGDKMTLINITGTNAATTDAISSVDTTSTVVFKDAQENGISVTGTHTDTIKSKTDSDAGNYKVTYTVGQKVLDEESEIIATELDLTKDTFKAGDKYAIKNDTTVTIDIRNIGIKDIGDGSGKDIVDFSDDTGSGKFTLKSESGEGSTASNTIDYTETAAQAVNGITAAGNQYRNFSVSESGKVVSLDSVTKDVNKVTVGSYIDLAKDPRPFTDLAEKGTVESESVVLLDHFTFTKSQIENLVLATATGAHAFDSNWTLPEDQKEFQISPEEGVNGVIVGKYNTDAGNLTVKTESIKSLSFGSGIKWRDDTVIDLAGTGLDLTGALIDASGISFNVGSVSDIVTQEGAYQMVLVNTDDTNHLDQATVKNNENISLIVDNTLEYTAKTELTDDKKQLVAKIDIKAQENVKPAEQTHHNVMAQNAAMNAVVTGAVQTTDMISTTLHDFDMKDMEDGATFGHIGGSSTNTKTGSHVASNMWNVDVGVATRKEYANGRGEYALYYEGGNGNYTTHDDAAPIPEQTGKLKYHGAGFLFRYEGKNNVYGEAGFHAGRIKNESDALSIDNSATYYGFHLGVGKILNVSDKKSVDIYAKFYLNRTGGIEYGNKTSDVKLDAVTSKLLRIGGRYNHKMNDTYTFYAGAAFAYEFGGKAEGEVTHALASGPLDIRPASTRGASGLFELGFKREATKTNPWEIDLGLKGYVGNQRGFGGNIGFKYHF